MLDANAITDEDFFRWLRSYRGDKILPGVAYVEAAVFVTRRTTIEAFNGLLRATGIAVEFMGPREAQLAIELAREAKDFHEHARDYLIGVHALSPPRIMVTENLRHCQFLERVVTPLEIQRRHKHQGR